MKVKHWPYIHVDVWRVLPAVQVVRMFYHIFRNQKAFVPCEIVCDYSVLSRQQKHANKTRI